MITQFDENRKSIFSKKLRTLIDGWNKTHDKKLTQEELASSIHSSREAVSGWLRGKSFPADSAIPALCEFFSVPPTFFDPEEKELIFTSEKRHRELDGECRKTANHVGLSDSVLQFIRERPGLADLVISASWVDPVVNPPDSKVPNSSSVFQYESSSGVRVYLPDEVLYMLRLVQRDLEDFCAFLIRKYSRVINEYHRPSAGPQDQQRVSPRTSFALDLEGMTALSPDESSIVSIMRLMDDKGRMELARHAAHIVHKERKDQRIPDLDAMIAAEKGEK